MSVKVEAYGRREENQQAMDADEEMHKMSCQGFDEVVLGGLDRRHPLVQTFWYYFVRNTFIMSLLSRRIPFAKPCLFQKRTLIAMFDEFVVTSLQWPQIHRTSLGWLV